MLLLEIKVKVPCMDMIHDTWLVGTSGSLQIAGADASAGTRGGGGRAKACVVLFFCACETRLIVMDKAQCRAESL